MTDDTCQIENCEKDAEWRWHDGMWSTGRYCAECIREKLEDDDSFPEHRDAITTEDNVTTIGAGRTESRIVPAGARPIESVYPTVRTKEALDEYLQEN